MPRLTSLFAVCDDYNKIALIFLRFLRIISAAPRFSFFCRALVAGIHRLRRSQILGDLRLFGVCFLVSTVLTLGDYDVNIIGCELISFDSDVIYCVIQLGE